MREEGDLQVIYHNIDRIIEKMREKDISSFISSYERARRDPSDLNLIQCYSLGSYLWERIDCLRRVICDDQAQYFGDWMNEEPKKFAPWMVEEYMRRYGSDDLCSIKISYREMAILKQLHEYHLRIHELVHIAGVALRESRGFFSAGFRKELLGQRSMEERLYWLKENSSWYKR